MPEPVKAPVIAETLGPGTLKITPKGGPARDLQSKVLKAELAPDLSLDDAVPMLDGSSYQPAGTWGGKLTGTFYQDYDMNGLVVWCLENAGLLANYEFIPKAGTGKVKLTGELTIAPVKIGGTPKKDNEAEFEFKLTGKPSVSATA